VGIKLREYADGMREKCLSLRIRGVEIRNNGILAGKGRFFRL